MSLSFKQWRKVLSFGIMISTTGVAVAGNPKAPAYTPDLLPPNPETGECYARVEVPAKYRTDSETVMIQEGYTALNVSQPQITMRPEDVLVKEASVRYEVRQPTYKIVTEQIMVRPAYERLSVIPPQFKKERETIQLSDARLVWKKGNPTRLRAQGYTIHSTANAGPSRQGYRNTMQTAIAPEGAMRCGETCEIWCLVEEPAKVVTYDRKVLSQPSQVRRIPVSAKYTSISKQVVSDPGGVTEVSVPAKYRSIMMETVNPGYGTREVDVPPQYGTIGKNVEVSPSRYEWRRVVCLPGTHPNTRRQLKSGQSRVMHKVNSTHTSRSFTGMARDLSGYTRTQYAPRTYGSMSSSKSRHHFTIPAQSNRKVLPNPIKSNVQGTQTNSDQDSYSHRSSKRSKPRYRNR